MKFISYLIFVCQQKKQFVERAIVKKDFSNSRDKLIYQKVTT